MSAQRCLSLCFGSKIKILKVPLKFAWYFMEMHKLRQIRVQGSQHKEDCLYVNYNSGNNSHGIFWEWKHTLNTAFVLAATWMITVDGRNNNRLLKSRYIFKLQRSVSAPSNSALSLCRVWWLSDTLNVNDCKLGVWLAVIVHLSNDCECYPKTILFRSHCGFSCVVDATVHLI